jgi:DNA (cytosine-5)-methyltransferase 1
MSRKGMKKSHGVPETPNNQPGFPIPTVSLFCGSGGLDLGFARQGFHPVLAVDSADAACTTFEQNFPGCRVLKQDLSRVPPGYLVDRLAEMPSTAQPVGVIGGPPCQAFSKGNVHTRSTDPRRMLPATYARLIGELRKAFDIDFFVFENVLGLRHKDHNQLFADLKGLFREAGFTIFEGQLDAKDFGVPQTRQRVFIVGFNKHRYTKFSFAFPLSFFQPFKTVKDAIGGLPEPAFFKRDLTPDKIPLHPNHWCMQPVSKKFSNGKLEQGVTTNGRPFRVLHWDRPSWTVAYGNREVHIHPSGTRRLSVYEAMLLQGFPDSYQLIGNLSAQIRMVSDAVPPALGEVIAGVIRPLVEPEVLKRTRRPPASG